MTALPRRASSVLVIAALGAFALGGPITPSSASTVPAATGTGYLVGTGIADITGEAAEVGMMGYAVLEQKTSGIHQRQRARAFVFADQATGKRVAVVNLDIQGVMQSVSQGVVRKLKAKYGDRYTDRNVLLSATHNHSGPGGYSHYALYNITVLGYQEKTYNAIVDGTVEAIEQADRTAKPGTLALGRSQLTDASVNRSRVAFDRNPAADKAAFPLGIDSAMTALRVRQDGGDDIGALTWFATHNTSMTNKNTLISGDNKGYASYAWEHDREGVRYRDPNGDKFVAAFAQTNAGDMSPNLNLKEGSGPTEDPVENTRIIGTRQMNAATSAYTNATALTGSIDYRTRYVDMSKVTVDRKFTGDGAAHTTCPAAMGTSFAAGSSEDGIAFDWVKEGVSNPFLKALGGAVFVVSPQLQACQEPKEVMIANGTTKPYPWSPEVLAMQLIKIGQLYLVAVPAEFTIVSGLRLRKTVATELGTSLDNVVLAGYANAYSGYVTTPEEYDAQHYEGGGTHFGRWTLPAYQQSFAGVAASMKAGTPAAADDAVLRELGDKQLNFQTGVVFDDAPIGKGFGSMNTDANAAYKRGETATVSFWTGHPKNNLHRNGTFLEVQRQVNGQWAGVADDGDWSTTYRWARSGIANSTATITWKIPADAPVGTYRIVHSGDYKNGWTGKISPFTGNSRTFTIG